MGDCRSEEEDKDNAGCGFVDGLMEWWWNQECDRTEYSDVCKYISI